VRRGLWIIVATCAPMGGAETAGMISTAKASGVVGWRIVVLAKMRRPITATCGKYKPPE